MHHRPANILGFFGGKKNIKFSLASEHPNEALFQKGSRTFNMSLSYDGSLLYCFGGSAERVRVGVVAVTVAISIAVVVYVTFAAITTAAAAAVSFAASAFS